jgi:hydrogenase maturation protein HypF
MSNQKCYKSIKIKGVVQGVGFRPFIYSLAQKNNISGNVYNSGDGVTIKTSSSEIDFQSLIKDINLKLPPLAHIDDITILEIDPFEYSGFDIIDTDETSQKSSLISPDIAICDKCKDEFYSKDNRRYNYYLINCTNCGPRYSIIKTLPYDRKNTSMDKFDMCKECKKEYKYPLDRRFHAQPISCHSCGPKLTLYDINKNIVASSYDAIKQCSKFIKNGKIVAVKGMGGFHIVCDAFDDKTITRLRTLKHRPTKPFAMMFKDIDIISKYTNLSKKDKELLLSKEKPIVLVEKKEKKSFELVAPHTHKIGVFLPYTPLQLALFEIIDEAIIATSANLQNEPIIKDKEDIFIKLGNIVELVLDFDRDIINANDDSIVVSIGNKNLIYRSSRGFTPTSVKTHFTSDKKILAVGAHQKNQIAIYFNGNIVLSPYIGDVDSIASMEFFQRTIDSFKKFYDFEPDMIVCDKHPGYASTKWAKEQNLPLISAQHHHSHILATMLEHNIKTKVLGFAWDGTGYGDDGTIWGGETLICENNKYERVYSLKPFRLLGGESSIKHINKLAVSMLFHIYDLKDIQSLQNHAISSFNDKEINLLYKTFQKEINSPWCSSMGRVFDIVASLLGLLHYSSYDGESGLLIEKYYNNKIDSSYPYTIIGSTIDIDQMIKCIIYEPDISIACSKFINTLAIIIADISMRYDYPVVLSGGVFQNKSLLLKVIYLFEKSKKPLYFQEKTPINDGSIALGQIVYALI